MPELSSGQKGDFILPYTTLSAVIYAAKTKKDILNIVKKLWESNLIKAVILVLVMLLTIKILNLLFSVFKKKNKNSLHANFIKSILQAIIIIFFLIQIGSLSDAMAKFYSSILMSSSLIVVVDILDDCVSEIDRLDISGDRYTVDHDLYTVTDIKRLEKGQDKTVDDIGKTFLKDKTKDNNNQ